MANVFKAINDLIDKYTAYKNDVIYKNYYNNVPLPNDNHYAIMFILDSMPQMAIMKHELTAVVADKTVTADYTQMNALKMQVDFYGKLAQEQSAIFATLLQSPIATRFLLDYGYTVQSSDSPLQIANPQDRDNYIDRYVVRFSVFNNVIFSDTTEGFTETDIKTLLER